MIDEYLGTTLALIANPRLITFTRLSACQLERIDQRDYVIRTSIASEIMALLRSVTEFRGQYKEEDFQSATIL